MVKVKVLPITGHESPEGSRGIALLFLDLGTQMGVGGQHHAPAALPPGNTRYPLYRRLGRPQGRSGRVRKISPPPGFDPRTAQPVASRYNDCAIPAHCHSVNIYSNWLREQFRNFSSYMLYVLFVQQISFFKRNSTPLQAPEQRLVGIASTARRDALSSTARVQTGSGVHLASYLMDTTPPLGAFPRVKWPECIAHHLPPSRDPVTTKWRYTSNLPTPSRTAYGTAESQISLMPVQKLLETFKDNLTFWRRIFFKFQHTLFLKCE